MNSFSIKRCWQVLFWLLSVNRVVLLGLFSGVFVGIFLIEMGILIMLSDSTPRECVRYSSGLATSILLLLFVVFVSTAFTRFTHLGSKQQRATFLMLPAMNLEKFLAVMFYVTVVCTSLSILAVALADSLRVGLMALLGQGLWPSSIPWIIGNLTPIVLEPGADSIYPLSFRVMYLVLLSVEILFVHAHYTLGATLLRKYSFVISSIVLMLWAFLAFKITIRTMYDEMHLFHTIWEKGHLVTVEVNGVAYIFVAMLFVAATTAYWKAYRIFRHFEINSNQWTNYDILKR